MKRLHVHVSVDDLAESIRFYSTLFKADPTVLKADYAKWMLDDPRVNFAISNRGVLRGLDHLGIQVESPDELHEISGRLSHAEHPIVEQKNTACCYARSDKAWARDPQGIAWETFFTFGETTTYSEGTGMRPAAGAGAVNPSAACCAATDAVSVTPAAACCAKSDA
jgi:catechol 2,3-dioxygenase-like lactoylglutathione lyase family enzyme